MYQNVSSAAFARQYEQAYRQLLQVQESCTEPGQIDWSSMSCYLEEDGNSGFAIKHWDDELCLVWSRFKGRGPALVAAACEAGAVQLDCFDGYLPQLYAKHGFVEYKREPNWHVGQPDVVYMRREVF